MKWTSGWWALLLAGLTGCVTMETGNDGPPEQHAAGPPSIPGVQGPWGQPVAAQGPYQSMRPSLADARAMMSESMPLDMIQQAGYASMPGATPDVEQAGGACPPGGCPPGMIAPPGVPFGPGVPGMGGPPGGAVAAAGALTGGQPTYFPTHRTSVRFVSPAGMKVSWFAAGTDGRGTFTGTQIEVPGRYNFSQAAIYRLKLTDIPNRPGLELYPTLEVVPSNARTDPFLAHSSVPVSFTEEDFEQVAAGNYVVKVIYLPSPQFQDLATTGPDEVVSSRLEPGMDPIAEAHRRGNILLVVRMGNIDLEAPNTPAMDAPSPYQLKAPPPPPVMPPAGMGPGLPGPGPGVAIGQGTTGGPGPMVPYDGVNSGRPLMMGPNGPPMLMTPRGLMIIGPPGQAPAGPGPAAGQPGSTLPPSVQGPSGPPAPTTGLPGSVRGPVTRLPDMPDYPGIQQAAFQASQSQAATPPGGPDQGQGANSGKKPSSPSRWYFGSGPSGN